MTLSMNRRAVTLGLLSAPALALPILADEKGYALDDVIIGDANAPLTVYEYVSYTCPACASYHRNIWPQVKETFVDTGKVQFVIRDFYRNRPDLLVGMTARCGGATGFYPMADAYLSTQAQWMRAPDVNHAVRQIARKAGLPNARIDACLQDEDYAKALVETWQTNMEAHEVRATPSFVINGVIHSGMGSFEEFAELINDALS